MGFVIAAKMNSSVLFFTDDRIGTSSQFSSRGGNPPPNSRRDCEKQNLTKQLCGLYRYKTLYFVKNSDYMEQLKDSLAEDSRLTNLIQIPLKKKIGPSSPPWSQVSSDHQRSLCSSVQTKFWKGIRGKRTVLGVGRNVILL